MQELRMAYSLLITGGSAPSFLPPLVYERTVCCDSGYDTARELGLRPDIVVGDCDSTKYREEIIKLGFTPCSHEKDESDTELGLMRLSDQHHYDLIGGGGGRLDHLLALFALFRKYAFPRCWLTASDLILSLKKGTSILTLPLNCDISFFSLSDTVCVCCDSLVWPLDDYLLDASSMSLSNRTAASRLEIRSSGDFLARIPVDKAPFFFEANTANINTCWNFEES